MKKESYIWSIGECRVKSEMANYVNFARRMRLPALHFQLDDHIPTMASYQTFIISLGVKPPPMAGSWTTSSLELRLSGCLRKVNQSVRIVRLLGSFQINTIYFYIQVLGFYTLRVFVNK